MIRIEGRAVTYGEVWFDEPIPPAPDVDILKIRLRPMPLERHACTLFLSLLSDLTADEQTLFAGFGGTNRYKIKRAQDRDRLAHCFITTPAADLDTFCAFYDAFAQQKGLMTSYRRGLWAACSAGRLILSSASRDGLTLVWHAYITDHKMATLLHTASHFRGLDTDRRALIARANRWLHWRDMLSLKALGHERLCWGGMFEDESKAEQASINNFKREFGGRLERSYDCTVPLTLKGRLCIPLLQLLDRLDAWSTRGKGDDVQSASRAS
jgi:hypothetical protein